MKKAVSNITELYPKLQGIENNFQKMIEGKNVEKLLKTLNGTQLYHPRELYLCLFEDLPNYIRIDNINFEKCLNWILDTYESEITAFSYCKKDIDIYEIDFPILTFDEFYFILKNNILLYLDNNNKRIAIYFTNDKNEEACVIENKCNENFYMNEVAEIEWKIIGYQNKLKSLIEE